MGHPQLGAERQGAVGRGHGVLVEALTGGGLAAGFIAVKGGHAREAVPAGDGAIEALASRQELPAAPRCVAAGVMVVMVAMVPGFGGSFGDAATDQESCGDKSERRARLGYSSQAPAS